MGALFRAILRAPVPACTHPRNYHMCLNCECASSSTLACLRRSSTAAAYTLNERRPARPHTLCSFTTPSHKRRVRSTAPISNSGATRTCARGDIRTTSSRVGVPSAVATTQASRRAVLLATAVPQNPRPLARASPSEDHGGDHHTHMHTHTHTHSMHYRTRPNLCRENLRHDARAR
jgi:hypothetical protein